MAAAKWRAVALIICVSWSWLHPSAGRCEVATYAIKQGESSIRVVPTIFKPPPDFGIESGTRFLDRYGIYEQSSGSLEATVTGTLTAQVSGSTLTFSGGNEIDVSPHPNAPFLPNVPTSPGEEYNFGAYVRFSFTIPPDRDGEAAVLDAVADLVGGTAMVGGPVTGLQFRLTSGVLDYRLDFPAQQGFIDLAPVTQTVPNDSMGMLGGTVNGTIRIPYFLEFPYTIVNTNDSVLVLEGELVASRGATQLPGDYNGDNSVDAADYVLWRKLNGTSDPRADGDMNGTVGPSDYALWRSNFGRAVGAGTGLSTPQFVVPERGVIAVWWIGLVLAAMRVRRG